MAVIQRESLWKKSCRDGGFQKDLETKVGKPLQLKINDNRTSLLSVKWERSQTRVSLHRMFLDAPNDVIDELAFYLKKRQKGLTPTLKAFIEAGWQRLDYSHLLDQENLSAKGEVHDLGQIFAKINRTYFNNQVELLITWYGIRDKRNRRQMTFGLYYDAMRLIKINRFLDRSDVPGYVVQYVVYHEMLHHVYPAFVEDTGRTTIHSKEFKKREKEFHAYDLAKQWIEGHYDELFSDMEE
jgi:hypothetical protein